MALAGYLHLLVPAGGANSRFCRTSLSGALLGYPYPLTINWDGNLCDKKFGDASWEWGKLHDTLKFLNRLGPERDDDIVVVADGEDTWFQLKPEVLIKRYQDIIKEAARRTNKRLGSVSSDIKSPEIVFAAQKRCHTDDKDHIGCYASPDPPKDLLSGPGDYDPGMSDTRPRYVNAAVIVGTASSLRKIHQIGWDRWNTNPKLYTSRQDFFASLFGEQEYQREQLRQKALNRFSSIFSSKSSSPIDGHAPPQSIMYAANLTACDHGITLDYSSLLAHVPSNDAAWIRHSDSSSLSTAMESLSLTRQPPSTSLSQDIAYSRPPLFSLAPFSSAYPFAYQELPRDLSWQNVPLYTNLITSVTPVMIINRDSNDDEVSLLQNWHNMWFSPHARVKLANVAYEPVFPLATTPYPAYANSDSQHRLINFAQKAHSYLTRRKGGERGRPAGEKQWWSPVAISPMDKHREGIGFLIDPDEERHEEGWKKWGEVCEEGVQGRIFGDEKGKWLDLKVYPPFLDVGPDA